MGWTIIKNYLYKPNSPLVNSDTGVPHRDGIDLILALYNRTGGGTGSPNQVGDVEAAGNSLATATIMQFDWNNVTSGAGGVAIPLAFMVPGADIIVFNKTGNSISVYPPDADIEIDALGNGSPYTLAPNTKQSFECWTPTQLHSG